MNEWDKKRRIMRRYDLTAQIYDMRYADEQTAKIKAALKNVDIRQGSLVLDVGCGTGLLFDYVAEKAETLVGIDIARQILLQAKKRAKNLNNVNLIWADVDHMPLRENVFSHVFAFTLIQNTPNPVKSLEEIKRVAKENAAIVVTGLKKVFTLKKFSQIMQSVGLKINALEDEGLKCYVAISAKDSPVANKPVNLP